MRILIGAGGTGGHVYPALATARALLRRSPGVEALYFIGAAGGMEWDLVEASGIPFAASEAVLAGPLHGVNPARMLSSLTKLNIGALQAMLKLRAMRPHAVLLTGGWANLPVALAAKAHGAPIVIFLPDIEPGLTIKVLQRFADAVAIAVDESARYFPPGKTALTGYPLEADRIVATREAALERFGLSPERKTLLVFGGSRGARSINVALGTCLERLLEDGRQVLHITGELDWARSQEQVGALRGHRLYRAFAYLRADMGLALAAADLAVCRAGASALAELPLFGLPAILAPYPHAWRYQKVNADYLSERGAALRLNDEDLGAKLYPTMAELLDDEARLNEMRASSLALANRGGAEALAGLLLAAGAQK